MKTFPAIALLSFILTATATAAKKPVESQEENHTYRITGLFSKQREADLRAVMAQIPEVKLVSINFEYAEATFLFDAAKVFPRVKPDKIPDKLEDLLRLPTNHTFGVEPLITIPKDQLKRIEIGVLGLDCKGCAFAAYEGIAKVNGVAQATVSFKEGRVSALIDPAKTNRAALEAALRKVRVELPSPQ